MNDTLVRLTVLKRFLQEVHETRQKLLDEMIDRSTDPIIVKRRFRMLRDLARLESVTVEKIYKFQSDVLHDWRLGVLLQEILFVTDRSA